MMPSVYIIVSSYRIISCQRIVSYHCRWRVHLQSQVSPADWNTLCWIQLWIISTVENGSTYLRV